MIVEKEELKTLCTESWRSGSTASTQSLCPKVGRMCVQNYCNRDFVECVTDIVIYYKANGADQTVMGVYVDVLIVAGTS